MKNCFRNYGTPHRSSTVSPGINQNGGAETGGVGLGPYNKVAEALSVNTVFARTLRYANNIMVDLGMSVSVHFDECADMCIRG